MQTEITGTLDETENKRQTHLHAHFITKKKTNYFTEIVDTTEILTVVFPLFKTTVGL